MNEQKMGQKIIDGRLVSLDDEKIEKLELISSDLKRETVILKEKIDKRIE